MLVRSSEGNLKIAHNKLIAINTSIKRKTCHFKRKKLSNNNLMLFIKPRKIRMKQSLKKL